MKTKGITESGFKFEVSENLADDYELIEVLVDLEANPFAVTKIMNKVLGPEQTSKLKEHLRDENGIVPLTLMTATIEEIFLKVGELKNS